MASLSVKSVFGSEYLVSTPDIIYLLDQIVWQPYGNIDELPDYCKAGRAIWGVVVPLLCMDCFEFHEAKMVRRQFGFVQQIPPSTFKDNHVHNLSRQGHHNGNWPDLQHNWLLAWNDRMSTLIEPRYCRGNRTMSTDYMEWYNSITRRRILPPTRTPLDRGFRGWCSHSCWNGVSH